MGERETITGDRVSERVRAHDPAMAPSTTPPLNYIDTSGVPVSVSPRFSRALALVDSFL